MKNRLIHFLRGLSALVVVSTFSLSAQAQTPPQLGEPPRFPQLTLDQLSPEVKPLAEEIIKISTSGIGGPYNIMLRSPVFAERMKKLLDYLCFNTSVPARLNEFAILIYGNLWKSQVEWSAHYPMALKAGLSKDVADDLKNGIRPRAMQPDEAIVYDMLIEMHTTHEVSDATFARAKKLLTDQQLVDVVAVSGTYITVAMLLALGKVMPPEGKPLPYPPAK